MVKSKIKQNQDGAWEEVVDERVSKDEHDEIRKSFSKYVFDTSLNFNSPNLETIAFTWRF